MIKDEKIKARFDMPDIGDVVDDNYKKTIHLTRRNFNFPQEIRLNSIVPNEIEITLGRLESKYIKVQIQKKGFLQLDMKYPANSFIPAEFL